MKKRSITLSPEELTALTRKTTAPAFQVQRAKILVKADKNGEYLSDPEIALLLEINSSTVQRTKKTFAEQGLPATLEYATAVRFKPRKLEVKPG